MRDGVIHDHEDEAARFVGIALWRDADRPIDVSLAAKPWNERTNAAATAVVSAAADRIGECRLEFIGHGREGRAYIAAITDSQPTRAFLLCSESTSVAMDEIHELPLAPGDHYFAIVARLGSTQRKVTRRYRLRLHIPDSPSTSAAIYIDNSEDQASLFTWWPGSKYAVIAAASIVTAAAVGAMLGAAQAGLVLDVGGAIALSGNAFRRIGRFAPGAMVGGGAPTSPPNQREEDRVTIQARLGGALLVAGFALQFIGALQP